MPVRATRHEGVYSVVSSLASSNRGGELALHASALLKALGYAPESLKQLFPHARGKNTLPMLVSLIHDSVAYRTGSHVNDVAHRCKRTHGGDRKHVDVFTIPDAIEFFWHGLVVSLDYTMSVLGMVPRGMVNEHSFWELQRPRLRQLGLLKKFNAVRQMDQDKWLEGASFFDDRNDSLSN